MRWKPFVDYLRSQCSRWRISTPAGSILQPTKALDLELVIKSFVETPDEVLRLAVTGVQSTLIGVWSLESLLTFRWARHAKSIDLLDVGGGEVFVCFDSRNEPYRVTAALEPKDEPSITQELVRSYFQDNGQSYGVELLGGLPDETLNWRPDILPAAIVKEAFWNWLLWAEREECPAWLDLRDSVISRLETPEEGERMKRFVRQLVNEVIPPGSWIDEQWDKRRDDVQKRREQEEKALSLDDRRLIFENYFMLSYREEDPRKSAFME